MMIQVEPPKNNRGAYDWNWIANFLREHPGEWYWIFKQDRASLANGIRQGGVASLRKHKGFRVLTRKNVGKGGARRCDMYLMYDPSRDETRPTTREGATDGTA